MSCHSSTHCAAESVPVCGRKKKSSSIWFDGSGDAMAGQMKNWQKKKKEGGSAGRQREQKMRSGVVSEKP